MQFLFSITLLLLTSLFISSLLKLRNKVSYILSVLLISFSTIVFISEISGFVQLLNKAWFFLVLQIVILILTYLIWFQNDKPPLFTLPEGFHLGDLFSNVKPRFKKDAWIIILFFILMLGYGFLAWLAYSVPPNNSDSMHTHLARVIYWLQQGSFRNVNTFSIFAQIYPFDHNLNILWTILLSQSDKYVAFLQFVSTFWCALNIFGISRLLKAPKRSATILSLLWLTMPIVVFQSTTTQNDLVVAALFSSSVYLFLLYFQDRNFSYLILSGIALGLSFGTKETTILMGLGILFMLFQYLKETRLNFIPIRRWVLISLGSFIILGSFPFFRNLIIHQNPFGPSEHVFQDSFGDHSILNKLIYNSSRLTMQFFSFDGLPVNVANNGVAIRGRVFSSVFSSVRLPLESMVSIKDTEVFSYFQPASWNEDMAWFGPVSFLLIIPSFIIGIIKSFRKKNSVIVILIFYCISFFILEILLRPGWDPYQGRYFIMSTALAIPVSVTFIDQKKWSKVFLFLLTIISLFTLFFSTVSNQQKPLLGKKIFEYEFTRIENLSAPKNFFDSYTRNNYLKILYYFYNNLPFYKSLQDYDEIQLRSFSDLERHELILREIEKHVPLDARMGVILGEGTFDYVFFGPELSRELKPINPISLIREKSWISTNHLDYVLVFNKTRIGKIPEYLEEIVDVNDWTLYSVELK